MAAVRKPARAKAGSDQDSVVFPLVVDVPSDVPVYYANHVELAINKHEIAMAIARLPTKPGRDAMAAAEASGELVVEAEMQILFPPTLLQGLISALETTKTKYEEAFGPIRKVKE